MKLPERMPVRASADLIRRQWLTWLCIVDALYGVALMFGKAEGAGQVLLRNIFPIPMWGSLMVVAGAAIWWGWSVRGALLGAFVWAFTAGASLASIVIGTALSYSGPIPTAFLAGCHALIAHQVWSGLDADRERRQRNMP
jgi:hypothetical protein